MILTVLLLRLSDSTLGGLFPLHEYAERSSSPAPSEERPPPYALHTADLPEADASNRLVLTRRNQSAKLFLAGTILAIFQLALLLKGALYLRNIAYCDPDHPDSLAITDPSDLIVFSVFYAVAVLMSSVGLMCWVKLLRDLWGPRATERYQIDELFFLKMLWDIVKNVVMVPVGSFVLLFMAGVWTIRRLQGVFCGGVVDGETGNERVDGEEGRRLLESEDGSSGDTGNYKTT